MDLLQPLLAVTFVLGLLWAAVHFLKNRKLAIPRLRGLSARKEPGLEVLGRVALTASHSICRVRDGERSILVGLSPNGIVLLSEPSVAFGELWRQAGGPEGEPPLR